MKLSITADLDYTLGAPTDMLLQLEAAALPEQHVQSARLDLPATDHIARIAGHDAIGERIWLRTTGQFQVHYEAVVAVERLTTDIAELAAVPPHLLPSETVDYMMPSRYCPSDEFGALVADEFGQLDGGERVAAIRDWIAGHLSYVPGSSTALTGALETYVERKGVCRDFAHLMIAMVRACAIPARFASVYGLGVEPQDFHAVAEVYLGNAWHLVDPTGMSVGSQMAKIGVGRDAADVSFLTSYGNAMLNRQEITVREL